MCKNLRPFLILLFAGLLTYSSSSLAAISLPRLINDGMVLQRNAKVKIWGKSLPNESVSVRFNGKEYKTVGSVKGQWMVVMDEMKEGGPFTMEIKGNNTLLVKDILIGDVWICSGQSNMELPMKRVKEKYAKEIANSINPNIRQFKVETRYLFDHPAEDFPTGEWKKSDPENVLEFTAVGYFFAKSLYEKYKVPIGLIAASVGGSPAEAWLSEGVLKEFPHHFDKAQQWKDTTYLKEVKSKESQMNAKWFQNIWQKDSGLHAPTLWMDPNLNDQHWPTMKVPGYWEDEGLKGVNGVVWFRRNIDVPATMTNKPGLLYLGCVVDCDSVFINGTFVGTTSYQYPPRRYPIPADLLKPGKNSIVVRVINNAGKGGFYKEKPYKIEANGETVDLVGTWKYKLGTTSEPLPSSTFFHYQPGVLFKAMISPLLNVTMKGVIWYQGESNTRNPKEYQQSFPAVITDWRNHWGLGNFPFLYVQLANYMESKSEPSESGWAEVREVQLKTLSLPNTAMAVAMDIGEWNDIHPLNKEDVGKRLSLCAQKVAYGEKNIVASGPLYKSAKPEGNSITVTFTELGNGLATKGNKELKGFAIAGEDKKFVWAKARIESNKVIVTSEKVKAPKYVRYAWADNPDTANLINKEGLPASPFRSDE